MVPTNTWFEKPTLHLARYGARAQKQWYNAAVQAWITAEKQRGSWTALQGFDTFADIVKETASTSLSAIHPSQRKSYLFAQTWQMIEEKQRAIQAGDSDKAKQLTTGIQLQARKDKESELLQGLEAIDSNGYKREGLKKARKSFQPI